MKILIADDHVLIRAGLRSELACLSDDNDYVDAWDEGSLRDEFTRHPDLDLALVDLGMPGMRGAATIAALREAFPAVPLIVLSGVDACSEVQSVLRAGASGYIPKSAMSQVMLQAIRLVLAGGQYLPPQLMDTGNRHSNDAPAVAASNLAPAHSRLDALSPRQREVFALLAKGLPNKRIARELGITEGTVKSHIAAIFDLLQVHNRVSAVAEARLLAGEAP